MGPYDQDRHEGGFLSTAATAAKEPVKLFDDLDAERMGKSAAEADLFKTLKET